MGGVEACSLGGRGSKLLQLQRFFPWRMCSRGPHKFICVFVHGDYTDSLNPRQERLRLGSRSTFQIPGIRCGCRVSLELCDHSVPWGYLGKCPQSSKHLPKSLLSISSSQKATQSMVTPRITLFPVLFLEHPSRFESLDSPSLSCLVLQSLYPKV